MMVPFLALAQSETEIDSLIVRGKQQLRYAALAKFKEQDLMLARAHFERLSSNESYAWLIRYYIALADYRLVSFYFSKQNKEAAKKYIEDGIEQLEACIEEREDFVEAYSLLSSFYGNKIGINPLLGITLGPKSGSTMAKAMSLEPHNPRNHLIAGWSAYFTPKMFGGGKDKAKRYFRQAIACFDSTKAATATLPDWGHDEACAWLGLLYMKQSVPDSARINFNRALEINPDNNWVKFDLLPKLNK